MKKSTGNFSENINRLKEALDRADAVMIGAGSGLSASAGLTYSGERFRKYFGDFAETYGIRDMYSGGFYPFPSEEERWAWWSRHIWVNRYAPIPNDVYSRLLQLVRDKDYFVLTTNVDHCFQRSGFDKKRLFYTQGDYGLFQCSTPCSRKTRDNEKQVRKMILSQGFEIVGDGGLIIPNDADLQMRVPAELIPVCPDCGREMSMNLRADDTFVEDDGWQAASKRYSDFVRRHENRKVLYLELGVGMNTPGIIKYPFRQYTAQNEHAVYACLNMGAACAPDEIADRTICIDSDIAEIIERI
jgi:NAD-dependent SIR2 family protein deacetylase